MMVIWMLMFGICVIAALIGEQASRPPAKVVATRASQQGRGILRAGRCVGVFLTRLIWLSNIASAPPTVCGQSCAWDSDGMCDVPARCAGGTDLVDCAVACPATVRDSRVRGEIVYASNATEHAFLDIAATGTKLLDPSTPESAEFPLPFDFPWYGENLATITVGVDGHIIFDAAPDSLLWPSSGISEPLPCAGACEETNYDDNDGNIMAATVDGMLAPFWADLDLGESGAVYVQAFADSVVVQWDAVSYSTPGPGGIAGLTLSIPSWSTHSCNGVYMATSMSSQGTPVYRNGDGTRFVCWWRQDHRERPTGWYCTSNQVFEGQGYFGYVPSSTPMSNAYHPSAKWYSDDVLETRPTRIILRSE
jgi:hypothetical protein